MTRLAKAIVATAILAVSLIGFSSMAGAAEGVVGGTDTGYPPQQCTVEVQGVETVVPCDPGVESEVASNDVSSGPAVASAVVSASGTLPYTGSDSFPLVQFGLALVAVGGIALLVVRNRQAKATV